MNKGILHIFASTSWGGGEQYVFDLSKKQIADGYRVALISGRSKAIKDKVKALDCHYTILKHRYRFSPFSIYKVYRIILHEKIDVVHVHQFSDAFIAVFASLLSAKKGRPKVILTRHLVKKGKQNRIYHWLYGKLHKLIFVSELSKKEFLTGASISEDKLTVIHNSITTNVLDTPHINYGTHFGINNDYTLIGFVGQIAKFKGVELLVEVAERVRNRKVAFFLAGSGKKSYEIFLKNLIAEKKLAQQFFLIGFINNPGMFISQMDIGILPSICAEAFGLSVLEFMQAGIPLIASNTGAQKEFISHEKTGLLVNPTADEITAALVRLLDDKNFRIQTGKNAQHVYKTHFNYENFYNKIMKIYNL
jgi:glycosyltransferase involved in cell wall biosynthesis